MKTNELESADAVIGRLRIAFDVGTDAGLAEELGVAPSTLSNWRRRNSVPYAECVRASGERFINLWWLLTGEGSADDDRYVPSAIDIDLLAMAIDLADRWMKDAVEASNYARAAVITDYYNSLSERYKELVRIEGPERAEILGTLRQTFAVPDDAAAETPSK